MLRSIPYKKSVKDILEEECGKMGWGLCKVVIYEDPREVEDIDNLTTSRFGITEKGPRVEFYTSIIDEVYEEQKNFIDKKYSSLEKYIQTIVRHEYRHYEQYKYIISHNIPLSYIDTHMNTMEKDAYDYEKGIINNLNNIIR